MIRGKTKNSQKNQTSNLKKQMFLHVGYVKRNIE